ncbi:MAG: endonuclease MutS2 [Deltaproteobacteria bacterium]|nr:endonuclease MutS2 [Deltaproteobacteria bacterium]
MRAKDLETLELDRLLDELARHASSTAGQEACRALRPRTELTAVRDELQRVADLLAISGDEPVPIGGFPDIRPHLAMSHTIGARLSGTELLEVASTLGAVRRLRGYLRSHASERPLLLASLASLHPLPDLDRRLADTLDDEGGLREDASPALRAVRRELRGLRSEIEARLTRLFRGSSGERLFAEPYVTLRNGRFVVPVRAQASAELPGIVQDRSSSGETLFVEPLFAVEPNNRLLIAAREEAEEEARILADLTGLVGENADALGEAFEALVDLDTLAARATFARRHGAICPRIDDAGDASAAIRLRKARHPLLVLTGRPVTPIDVELEAGLRLLVITGPNTGGKSVALKTLGLAAAMAQSGIPILATDDSALPLVGGLWTDIGDRQDVADDLSTFSGHVHNLAEILTASEPGSLVLLDEPGTGTDPDDGAALARVLLQDLVDRGAWVLATTHFQTVKVFALGAERATVAAVDFEPETFAPRYRLIYGSVGPSLGLDMARRLGLPSSLLAAAERERDVASRSFGAAVERLEAERRRYEATAGELEVERDRLREAQVEHKALADELREKRRRKWADELGEAKRFADELRSEGRRLLAETKRDPRSQGLLLKQAGQEQRARIDSREREIAGDAPAPTPTDAASIRPGDQVEVLGSGVRGTLVKIEGQRAQISRGALRFDAPVGKLRRISGAAAPKRPAVPMHRLVRETDPESELERPRSAAAVPSAELNLVGARVAPALARLETFLDRAALDDRTSVRIVHGHGTGALRDAVREYLAGSPYVDRFEEADPHGGGSGATIAHLR